MSVIYKTIKGCRTLPHVGAHPGWVPLAICILLGLVAGGLSGAALLGGCALIAFLVGAYGRADFSEREPR